MSDPESKKLGALSISVESDSMYFADNVPVEIRDASMLLVNAQNRTGRKFEGLPAGIYQVSAVLEDGREHSRLVEVLAGESQPVQLGAREDARTTSPVFESARFTRTLDSVGAASASRAPSDTRAVLIDLRGASLVRKTEGLWILECKPSVAAVPTALLRVGDRRTEISLPTSPPQFGPNLCAVRIDESSQGARATAWISPERTVANALQNMLASGHLSSAARIADQGAELLRDKYMDPTGAALGALILRKVGRLAAHESWIENLARDFGWIPDGKILLAALLVDRRGDLDRALGLALEAAKQRILYTESYSILLDLLRRWPDRQGLDRRNAALAVLAASSPYADWNSICLSLSLET